MKPGELIAERFEVEKLAGSGGMGAVYRAIDRTNNETVALKALHDPGGTHVERFLREAKVLAELHHPNIVRYIDHGRNKNGELYMAMEWVAGESLSQRIARQPLSVREGVMVVSQVAKALASAHGQGIVHRDIKPSNLFVLFDSLTIKVLDFGIARLSQAARLTGNGMMLGTPGYMAPEQARGAASVDARADVFSLGCVLFKCLTGRPPFMSEDVRTVLAQVLFDPAPPVSSLRPEVTPALDALVARMLSKKPADRPADGAAVAAELEALLPGLLDLPAIANQEQPRGAFGFGTGDSNPSGDPSPSPAADTGPKAAPTPGPGHSLHGSTHVPEVQSQAAVQVQPPKPGVAIAHFPRKISSSEFRPISDLPNATDDVAIKTMAGSPFAEHGPPEIEIELRTTAEPAAAHVPVPEPIPAPEVKHDVTLAEPASNSITDSQPSSPAPAPTPTATQPGIVNVLNPGGAPLSDTRFDPSRAATVWLQTSPSTGPVASSANEPTTPAPAPAPTTPEIPVVTSVSTPAAVATPPAEEVQSEVQQYMASAEEALGRHQLPAAISASEKGFRVSKTPEEKARFRLIQAEAHLWRGENKEALPVSTSALAQLPLDTYEWGRAASLLASSAGRSNQQRDLAGLARLLLEMERFSSGSVLGAAAVTCQELLELGKFEQAKPLEARIRASAMGLDIDPEVQAQLLLLFSQVARNRGDLAGARRGAQAAADSFQAAMQERSEAEARLAQATWTARLGELSEAGTSLSEVLGRSRHWGAMSLMVRAAVEESWVQLRVERYPQAMALAKEAVQTASSMSDPIVLGRSQHALAEAMSALGQQAEAESLADEALALLKDTPRELAVQALLAKLRLERLGHAPALELTRAALAKHQALGQAVDGEAELYLVHAQALFAAGLRDAGRTAINEAKELLRVRAQAISAASERQTFLTRRPENRQILEQAAWWLGAAAS
jgi:serine/threonine protein kinase/tetratricopeptide (TPR) repeat protein